jgi:hypothetical protein
MNPTAYLEVRSDCVLWRGILKSLSNQSQYVQSSRVACKSDCGIGK